MNHKPHTVDPNPWAYLKKYTPARIALGHAGGSITTSELLQFQIDHAYARNAIHSSAEFERIKKELMHDLGVDCTLIQSSARNRQEYLKRPDLGRVLNASSKEELKKISTHPQIALVVGDGLSASAINLHAVPLLNEIHPLTNTQNLAAHIVLAKEARVALGDEIGEILGSSIVVILIGERPGLSNAESIGAYITYAPKVGRTDAERNCISNICPIGLSLQEAAKQIVQLLCFALQHRETGVILSGKIPLLSMK